MVSFLSMIKILIADDHQVLLDGFISIFKDIEDISVVATAADGTEVLALLNNVSPDVILMDIKMPKLNGVETCKKVKKIYPSVKVVALSMHDQMSYIKRMFQFGASGYLLKNDSSDIIERAIRAVMSGKEFLSPQIEGVVRQAQLHQRRGGIANPVSITDREKEVLEHLAEGLTDGQIGKKLFLSVHTINSHRKRLLSKFGAKNSAELVKICMEKGLL